jgi:septal ring factor EnvC (AmiA/AmiB activator)
MIMLMSQTKSYCLLFNSEVDSPTVVDAKLNSIVDVVQSVSLRQTASEKQEAKLTTNITTLNGQVTILTTKNTALNGQVEILTANISNLNGQVEILMTNNTNLNGQVEILTTNNTNLNGQVEILTRDNSDLNRKVNFMALAHINERNILLVRQIIYAYQKRIALKFQYYAQATTPTNMARSTHKKVANKVAKNETQNVDFKRLVEDKFREVSNGNMNGTDDIDTKLALVRNLGTSLSHPYNMLSDTFQETPPTAEDMRRIIDALDTDEITKIAAHAALEMLLTLCNPDVEIEFLKTN